jgi:hypothetical protein
MTLISTSSATRGALGSANIELIAQWDSTGTPTAYRPGQEPVELDPGLCTWIHTRLPEVDPSGRRATRTDWEKVSDQVRGMGLVPPSPEQQSALGTPLSDKPGVLTALGAAVITARDNRFGSRDAVRLTRISLVPVSPSVLVSARHRDGFDWVDPVELEEIPQLRDLVLRKRDPYRSTSLLASIVANDWVEASTRADELAIELVLAVSQAYPRTVLDKFSRRLSQVEQALVDLGEIPDPHQVGDSRALSNLLCLIAAVGRLEQEMNFVLDDLEFRTKGRAWEGIRVAAAEASLRRALDSLGRLRGDARTTVDMIGSTRASAHLKIAEEQRVEESQQREREQRLARTIALLTSALLIPTLVASVFGANVSLPREGTVWKTWLMFTCMVGLGSLAYGLLREMDPTRDLPPRAVRVAPYLLGLAALGAGVVIAIGGLGTS